MLTFSINEGNENIDELRVKEEYEDSESIVHIPSGAIQEKEEEGSVQGYDTETTDAVSEQSRDKWINYISNQYASRKRKRSLSEDSGRERKSAAKWPRAWGI